MEIGTLLRKLRDKHKFSARTIAEKTGVSQSTYTDWENDRTSPSLKNYIKLAEAFQITPVELMNHLTGSSVTESRQ